MQEIEGEEQRPPGRFRYLAMSFVAFGIFICWGTLAQVVIIKAGSLIYGKSYMELVAPGGIETQTDQVVLMISLFFNSLLTYGGAAFLFLLIYKVDIPEHLGLRKRVSLGTYALVFVFVIAAGLAQQVLVDFNEWLSGAFSEEALSEMRKQQETAVLSSKVFAVTTFWQFLINVLAVAVGAAVGEELFFRGVMQPAVLGSSGNRHVAVVFAGVLFSLVHNQFFHIIPIAVMGISFGYLYLWTGSLLVPIAAHFLNNFLGVLAPYLYATTGSEEFSPSAETPAWLSIIGLLVAAALFFVIYRRTQKEAIEE